MRIEIEGKEDFQDWVPTDTQAPERITYKVKLTDTDIFLIKISNKNRLLFPRHAKPRIAPG